MEDKNKEALRVVIENLTWLRENGNIRNFSCKLNGIQDFIDFPSTDIGFHVEERPINNFRLNIEINYSLNE